MKEILSALVDAEVDARERAKVLEKMLVDDELRAVWGRYHVARAVLRQEWDGCLSADFSARVQAALAAPGPDRAAEVVAFPARGKGRQYARFALAASLTAAAALFGLRVAVVGDHKAAQPLKTALSVPLPRPHHYVTRAHWHGARWRNRLNAFLIEHAAVAPFAGMNGMSYVRLAAYNGPLRGVRQKP